MDLGKTFNWKHGSGKRIIKAVGSGGAVGVGAAAAAPGGRLERCVFCIQARSQKLSRVWPGQCLDGRL